ncbi:hypothetical protein GOP47_0001616 [Adiantum capillus-veneris]|uniref:Uncharacterized protein n=1 Tax=Adiantum capillus-veneris TaxID=13818 RepID=A0A9D4VA20_ADICA|nr:hypothetical protein GOP47_0001616 [Adiantum capillus-veneris]
MILGQRANISCCSLELSFRAEFQAGLIKLSSAKCANSQAFLSQGQCSTRAVNDAALLTSRGCRPSTLSFEAGIIGGFHYFHVRPQGVVWTSKVQELLGVEL